MNSIMEHPPTGQAMEYRAISGVAAGHGDEKKRIYLDYAFDDCRQCPAHGYGNCRVNGAPVAVA